MTAKELRPPERADERLFGVFFGRVAVRVDALCVVGDRLPGTSGAAIAEQWFSCDLPGYVSKPARRYYPFVALRFPMAAVRAPRLVRRARAQSEAWWTGEVASLASADLESARRSFVSAVGRLEENLFCHGMANFSLVQSLYDLLARLVAKAGVTGEGLLGGSGSYAESGMVVDLWDCSRGRLDLDTFLRRHGYHGPREGEMSSVMWREDPAPLLEIIDGYRAMGDEKNPANADGTRNHQRAAAERELLAALPKSRRAGARVILAMARRYVPLRGVAKVALLQSIDVCRAAARRMGGCLTADGLLDDPSDIFFLTLDEVRAGHWDGARELVAFRRARHESHQDLDLPVTWRGMPEPITRDEAPSVETMLDGMPGSPGVAEGVVRVLTDPGESYMEPGEILVAHTTDPSWASVLFLSSALVTDIGGQLSHAAIVARELGVPCVVNTRNGTTVLRTGDRCRVDGTAGRVEVLERAVDATTPETQRS